MERVFGDFEWSDPHAFAAARRRARTRAREVLEAGAAGPDATPAVTLVAAAELFAALRVGEVTAPSQAASLVCKLEQEVGISRIALAREVLHSIEMLTVSPAAAVHAQLATLTALAPVRSVSLWALDEADRPYCVRHEGEGEPSRGVRQTAQKVLAREGDPSSARRLLIGLPVGRWRQPLAVLVASAKPGSRDACHAFLGESVPMLCAILEREALLAGNAASERVLVETSERKLTRLGFDLHDGPLQEVAILAEDLRLLRSQLESRLEPLADGAARLRPIRGRMEDLDAQVAALDINLRRISNEVRAASVLLNRPFPSALRDVAHAFAARTGLEPRLSLEGDMKLLSASQQIALLNIIREALSNIREHSDATRVEVQVSVNSEGVEAQVIDNGQGFEPEATLLSSARTGHLGLLAMHERARLLGGQCRMDSRPGGPTVISVALDRWEPTQSTR
jgi:signal transduction histidine kinase